MSSPVPHLYASASRTDSEASPSSPGLYVPVHRRRRTPGYASSSDSGTPTSSPASSPCSSARSLSPLPTSAPTTMSTPGIYTPDELLTLSHSPLIAQMSAAHVEALRAVAPEVVQTRKQRKALAWRARQATAAVTQRAHGRTPSRGSHSPSPSESEEDRAVSWRRV